MTERQGLIWMTNFLTQFNRRFYGKILIGVVYPLPHWEVSHKTFCQLVEVLHEHRKTAFSTFVQNRRFFSETEKGGGA